METTAKKVSHAPGPWHFTAERGGKTGKPIKFCYHAIRDKEGIITLSTFAPDSEQVSEANAKLAAAAPELLEALKGLTAYFKFMVKDPEFKEYVDAVNAIKKATE